MSQEIAAYAVTEQTSRGRKHPEQPHPYRSAFERERDRRTRTAKAIIDRLVSDCIDTTREAVAKANIKTIDDVYANPGKLIVLSEQNDADLAELEKFLLKNFYLHPSIRKLADQVKEWLAKLFVNFCRNPELMPRYFQKFIPRHGPDRTVCDYIAGMTDRFALTMINEIQP